MATSAKRVASCLVIACSTVPRCTATSWLPTSSAGAPPATGPGRQRLTGPGPCLGGAETGGLAGAGHLAYHGARTDQQHAGDRAASAVGKPLRRHETAVRASS